MVVLTTFAGYMQGATATAQSGRSPRLTVAPELSTNAVGEAKHTRRSFETLQTGLRQR